MSAIWGIAAQHIDESLRAVFDRMAAIMSYSETSSVNALITDQIALGHSTIGIIHKKGFPLRCDDGSSIAICGLPIWESGYPEINTVDSSGDDRQHDTKLLQYALNEDRLSDLGGVYASAKWNSHSKKLTLGTDRLGFKGLYYYYDENSNVLYFASRLRGLTQSVPSIDDIDCDAVKEFLDFGHSLGDKTFYSKIKLVPPGNLLEYDSSGIRLKEYWNIGNICIDHSMSYQDAVECNAAALKKAMARRICRCKSLDTTLLLSGGADSRRIAGELSCQGAEFKSYTTRGFTEKDSEAAIAAAVADTLKVENNFIELPIKGFVSEFWSRANNITDYECCLHQWLLPLADKLPGKSGVNYDGIAGDILIEGVFRASGFADKQAFNKINNQNVTVKAEKIIGKEVPLSFLKPPTQNLWVGNDKN